MTDTATGTIDRDELRRYVGRVLALHDERAVVNAQIHNVYEEAKDAGFVPKILRQIVAEQKMAHAERNAEYAMLDRYRHALGMLADTPLGDAAMAAELLTQLAAVPVDTPRGLAAAGAVLEAEAVELGKTMRKPRPFAEQPAKRPPGRPRKRQSLDELLDRARDHLGEPAGTA